MKKLISILLTATMLLSFAACSDAPDAVDKETAPEGTASVTDGDAETTKTPDSETLSNNVLELPEENFEGATFNILNPDIVNWNYTLIDFDEPSDHAYENAVYERNSAVEELLGVTITASLAKNGSGVYDAFKTAVDANTGDYQISFNALTHAAPAVGAGYCYSLDEFEYIDLGKTWWNRDCTDQLALGNVHYMAAGDIALSDKECMWAMYFIKDLITKNGLESPYELVENNEWTWEKMHEMASIASFDFNGSGTLDEGDIYGFCTHEENWAASWQSAGLKLVTLDNNGIPKLSWNSELFTTVYEDTKKIMHDTENVSSDGTCIVTNLMEGKTLFGTEVIAFVPSYRDNEHEFGILPYPKYNSDVDRFYTYMAKNSCTMVIGKDCKDTYFVGVVAEALAAKGAEILTPAYYEGQLKSRYSRDEESADMLDIIFNNRCYDLGVFFDWGGVFTSLKTGNINPATLYPQTQKKFNKQIEQSLEKLGIY